MIDHYLSETSDGIKPREMAYYWGKLRQKSSQPLQM